VDNAALCGTTDSSADDAGQNGERAVPEVSTPTFLRTRSGGWRSLRRTSRGSDRESLTCPRRGTQETMKKNQTKPFLKRLRFICHLIWIKSLLFNSPCIVLYSFFYKGKKIWQNDFLKPHKTYSNLYVRSRTSYVQIQTEENIPHINFTNKITLRSVSEKVEISLLALSPDNDFVLVES
jgi:hypothetical protein